MAALYFVIGFLMCGFIAYGIVTWIVFKALRGEKIYGFDIRPVRRSYGGYVNYSSYKPKPPTVYQPIKSDIAKGEVAREIVEVFEDYVKEHLDELVPDFMWKEDRKAYIYGESYADLVDQVKELL